MPNLVFKYNWDHRPIPINTGQGRLQFSLPFASGSLSLAPNFSQVQGTAAVAQGGTGAGTAEDARKNLGAAAGGANSDITEIKGLTTALTVAQGGTGGKTASDARSNLGLGTASTATLTTSTSDSTMGRVLKVGDFGLALPTNTARPVENVPLSPGEQANNTFMRVTGGDNTGYGAGVGAKIGLAGGTYLLQYLHFGSSSNAHCMIYPMNVQHNLYHGTLTLNPGSTEQKRFFKILDDQNTTTDANGYIKAASPICNLYIDHIELNNEAEEQPITFEKVDVGNYLIRGSLGFAQEGWYIEMPKDANGNVLVAVKYQQLKSGDIQVKTFAKRFDEETGDIVPNLLKPRDIPEGRFISLRLQGLPEPEFIDDPEIMESDLISNDAATAEGAATQSPEEQPAK